MGQEMIRVEGLSKSYTLHHRKTERYTALRDVIADNVKGLFRPKATVETSEEFFALRDISFTVNAGDRVGIIGRNGAGKSTLLKVLSRITEPTHGRIVLNGRVASLLEVGTGFHPELSGRENIYLNGAILGMSRAEITAKFDEIVAFAEVERFLDTPVKRYSSGMYVRLAFAVAAHLEPEILVVDEVLAVGDSKFQQKCLGKMEDVSKGGRTILFVSHQMDAVQRLCNKGLLLEQGKVAASGSLHDVIHAYTSSGSSGNAVTELVQYASPEMVAFTERIRLLDPDGRPLNEIRMGTAWALQVDFMLRRPVEGLVVAVGISTVLDLPVRTSWSLPNALAAGRYSATFRNDHIHLTAGVYKVVIGLSEEGRNFQHLADHATITVSEVSALAHDPRILNTRSGLLLNQMDVEINPLDR
ncbi:MAG: ABC transporter ATP-binding protein [Flavobacteriales bacterium]|nr:MAG: ABC transporter ATP-binding protein [Flavobacteriales bacterium]